MASAYGVPLHAGTGQHLALVGTRTRGSPDSKEWPAHIRGPSARSRSSAEGCHSHGFNSLGEFRGTVVDASTAFGRPPR